MKYIELRFLILSFTLSISPVTLRKHEHVAISRENNDTDRSWRGNNHLQLKGVLRKEFFVNSALSASTTNTICSPISVLMPLGKLALGAEGQSLEELLNAIGVSTKNMIAEEFKPLITVLRYLPGVKLDIASKLYVSINTRLQRAFVEKARDIFESSAEKIDFQYPTYATEQINSWVSSQTNGIIKDILSPSDVPPSTSLVLVNAVYFSGKWKEPFEKTYDGTFYGLSGKKSVKMMTRIGYFNYTKSDALASQIVAMPYMGEKAIFLIVLPKSRNGLSVLLKQLKLAPEVLDSAMSRMTSIKVHITMPKFQIESTLDLNDMFNKMGVKQIFDPQDSGLTKIIRDDILYVSSAKHKAFIDVNEFGTEAGASSAVVILNLSQIIPTEFLADHPFLFFIIVNGEQLFAGTYVVVVMPKQSQTMPTEFLADCPFLFFIIVNGDQLFAGTYVE